MILPENAHSILKARMNGLVSKDPLVIVYTGKRYGNYSPIVYADANRVHDWRFAQGLPGYVIWQSTLPGFEEQMRQLCLRLKPPVEYYVVDRGVGGSFCLLPRMDDVDAIIQRKMDQKRMRWDLDHLPWFEWQNADMQRFLKEIDRGTGTRFY